MGATQIIALTCILAAGEPLEIKAFSYEDTAAAREHWSPQFGSEQVRVEALGDGSACLALDATFSEKGDRACWDWEVPVDLSESGRVSFEVSAVNGGLGGNIGSDFGPPASGLALMDPPPDWFVVEVSSFQLADVVDFSPAIGVVTNLAPDHLEGKRQIYRGRVFLILRHLQPAHPDRAASLQPASLKRLRRPQLRALITASQHAHPATQRCQEGIHGRWRMLRHAGQPAASPPRRQCRIRCV